MSKTLPAILHHHHSDGVGPNQIGWYDVKIYSNKTCEANGTLWDKGLNPIKDCYEHHQACYNHEHSDEAERHTHFNVVNTIVACCFNFNLYERTPEDRFGAGATSSHYGNGRADCRVSVHVDEETGDSIMKVREIKGIAGAVEGVFPKVHPAEIDLPVPLPDDMRLEFHSIGGIEALEVIGAPVPTFIPCMYTAQARLCKLLGREAPDTSAD